MSESARSTRERILTAALHLLTAGDARHVTMATVARASGVSRQSVYLNFGDRAGLLVALVRYMDDQLGFTDALAEAARPPPVEAFEALLRAWCAHLPRVYPVSSQLEAAGGDEGVALEDRLSGLHAPIRSAVRRLQDSGTLAPGWTVDEAADWVWAMSHVTAWKHLVLERAWTPERFRHHVIGMVMSQLVVTAAS
jgi:AcrR family transcriptional regulator